MCVCAVCSFCLSEVIRRYFVFWCICVYVNVCADWCTGLYSLALSFSLSSYRSCIVALGADGAADAGCERCRSGSCR